jgi:hypothetical protein
MARTFVFAFTGDRILRRLYVASISPTKPLRLRRTLPPRAFSLPPRFVSPEPVTPVRPLRRRVDEPLDSPSTGILSQFRRRLRRQRLPVPRRSPMVLMFQTTMAAMWKFMLTYQSTGRCWSDSLLLRARLILSLRRGYCNGSQIVA